LADGQPIKLGGRVVDLLMVLIEARGSVVPSRDPAIFAIGDCGACPLPGGLGFVPPRAQASHQQADHMLVQIERRLRGQELQPFVHRDFGSLVSLGHHSTVGNVMKAIFGRCVFIEGLFARLMYHFDPRVS
jgi:NADH dehydrogenase